MGLLTMVAFVFELVDRKTVIRSANTFNIFFKASVREEGHGRCASS